MNEPRLALWLKRMIYSSALVPLVIFSQYISPFHFGKVMVIRTLVQVMAALYLLLIWREPAYRPRAHPITWAFLAFTLAFTLTTLTSVSPLQSFWGTLERMGGLFTFWHYFIFYIITVSVLRTRRDWEMLLNLMVAVGVISAFYGFLQRYTTWASIIGSGNRARPFGTIGNAALFAGYQILVATMAATSLFTKRLLARVPSPDEKIHGFIWMLGGLALAGLVALIFNGQGLWIIPLGLVSYGGFLVVADTHPRGAWWFYAVSGGLMFLAAAMTAVRGSLLAMIVATIVTLLLWSSHSRTRHARVALVSAIGGVLALVFLAILLRPTSLVQNSPYLRRVTDFSSSTFTVQTRFWAWSAGIQGWTDAPRYMLVGWGPENFNIPFSKYFNPKFFTGPGAETFFDRAHNMFIEVLVTMGAVGILTYLGFFATLLWTLARFMRRTDDDRMIGIGFTAMTVAYAIHNSFIFDTSANFLTFFILLAFVVVLDRTTGPEERAVFKRHLWSGAQVITAALLAIVVTVSIYKFQVKPIMANYATTRAIIAGWRSDWDAAITNYRRAIAYHTPGRYEFRNRFAQYLLEASNQDVVRSRDFQSVMLEAIDEVKKNIEESPLDYLPILYVSRMYSILGSEDSKSPYNDLALQYTRQALDISPTFIRSYYELAQIYLNKHDLENAFKAFQRALELNPDVGLTYWYLAAVLFQAGQYDQGLSYVEQALAHGHSLSESDMQRLISVYLTTDNFKGVVASYEQLVKLAPTNVQYWIQLAAAYDRVGRAQDAITAARRVIVLSANDPETRAQAEAFIRKLGGTP